jgi:hypothetical protein
MPDFTRTPLDPRLQAKAQHLANHLNALSPFERALVIHEAELLWDERLLKRQSVDEDAAARREDELALCCLYLARAFRELSPPGRQIILELVQEMIEGERIERMLRD